ncbi:MAG: aminotransferase class IV [Streptosporangiaceae bacterium]
MGGPAAAPREDLPAGRAPGQAARLGAGPGVRAGPVGRGDHRAGQPDPGGERHARRGAHQAHLDPRGQAHLRHGSAAQPGRPDPDRAGRVQGPGVRPRRDHADHRPKIHHNNLLPSILAKIEANVAGADDAVMLDPRGFIAETNATHIFWVTGGTLATPTTVSCPEGITRAAVLELAAAAGIACRPGDYTLPQLYTATEAFVTGTMGGLTPVIRVDGRPIGDESPGPVTKRLAALYADLTATTGTPVT